MPPGVMPRVRVRWPISPALGELGALANLPVILPGVPPGAQPGSGLCNSPRPDITGMVRGWSSTCGVNTINAANGCLDGQAGAIGGPWNTNSRLLITNGQYRTGSGLTRYQVLRADCYAGPFPSNPIAPRPMPVHWPAAVPVAFPRPVRDALLGYGLPHGRDHSNGDRDAWGNAAPRYTLGISYSVSNDPHGQARVNTRARAQPQTNAQTPRGRERKFPGQGRAGRALAFLLTAFSEGRDAIQSVHAGLPERIRRGRRGSDTVGQLRDIIDNVDRIDWEIASREIWYNVFVEDAGIGRGYQRIEQAGLGDIERRLDWLNSYAHDEIGRDNLLDQGPLSNERE